MSIAGRKQRYFSKPNNTCCAIRSHSSTSTGAVETPPLRILRWVAFTTGLPFVGFGFMDNAILIIAGDYIDTSLGVTLGISTLCAAAIGNIISDLAGIGCAAYIEEFCATTLKLPIPKLSSSQRQLRSVRMASQGGMAIGMTIGCFLGMIPLFFIDSNKADKLREKARLERLYKDVLNEAKSLVEAESTRLYLRVDKDDGSKPKEVGVEILPDYHPSVNGEYLYSMYYVEPDNRQKRVSTTTDTLIRMVSGGRRGSPMSSSSSSTSIDVDGSLHKNKTTASPALPSQGDIDDDAVVGVAVNPPPEAASSPLPARVIPIGKGIVSRAVLTGTTWNIAGNLMNEPDFYPLSIEISSGSIDPERFRDCAVVPILDGKGRVIAVLEALNKKGETKPTDYFGKNPTLDNSDGGFTDQDVEILLSLASHVSVSLQKIYKNGEEDEEDFGRLRDTIRILKEGKGIKRSMTRRKSIIRDEEDRVATHNVFGPSKAGRTKTQLFPD